jgi:hypothetical protein
MPACSAKLYYDRVERLSRRTLLSKQLLLGHVMAHELGHLLLGSNSHSERDLMREMWWPDELRRAAIGKLFFTPE